MFIYHSMKYKLKVEDRDYDTLAGFILEKLTDIPKTGECVEFEEKKFIVQTVTNNRIEKLLITKKL